MADLYNEFIKILKAFEEEDLDYILIGGFAVVIHGFERLTRDMDIFLKIVPENVVKLKKALLKTFNDHSIEEITIDDLKNYSVIRYGTPNGFCIDIMAKLGEMFSFNDLNYELKEVNNTKVKIATPETLYKLKKDTLRVKDKIDLVFLEKLIEKKRSNDTE